MARRQGIDTDILRNFKDLEVFKPYPVFSLARITAVAAAAFLLLVLSEGGSALAQEKLTVRLDFVPWGVHAAMHLAQDRGWFEEAGLEVEVQDGRGSNNTLQLVNAGQVDIGQIQLGLLPFARQEGAELMSFAGWLRRTDLCVLVDRGSRLEKIEDLKGKSLAVFAASPWAPFIDAFLEAGGLDRNDTEVLFVDPAALWGTYTSGRADGLMSTLTSAVPVAEKSRPSETILLSEAGIIFPSYGLVAREETLANRKDALAKFVQVQQRAWVYLADGHVGEGVAAIRAQRPEANLDPNVLRGQIELSIDYFNTPATEGQPLGWQAENDWNAALTSMERAGAIEPGWSPSDYYTNDLIE
jgi:NitT/TauT family transport system substrate-binding protein